MRGGKYSIVEKQARHGPDAPPVFRSESGGELMTLPGGVLLVLDATLNEKEVEDFFSNAPLRSMCTDPILVHSRHPVTFPK